MNAWTLRPGDHVVLSPVGERRYGALPGPFVVVEVGCRNGYRTPWVWATSPGGSLCAFRGGDLKPAPARATVVV